MEKECLLLNNNLQPLISNARNLGVIFNSALKYDGQINSAVKGCYFQLRNTSKLKSTLSFNNKKTVTATLISSRWGHCSSLYLFVDQSSFSHLQNTATRLLVPEKENTLYWTGFLSYTGLNSRFFCCFQGHTWVDTSVYFRTCDFAHLHE